MTAPHPSHSPAKSGFTLLELSMVLTVIALIVGGVVLAKNMIRASELRSVLSDVEKFKSATNTFQTKYACLPGDCANATSFFGTDPLHCPIAGGSTGTCNGDGNGVIFINSSGYYEFYLVWQHLALAKMISGNYTGNTTDVSYYQSKIGTNIPGSRIKGVGYDMGYLNIGGNVNPAWILAGTGTKHRITVGQECTSQFVCGVFASPNELQVLESKIDDGNPATGILTVLPTSYKGPVGSNVGKCADWGASATAAGTKYINSDLMLCIMVFDLGI